MPSWDLELSEDNYKQLWLQVAKSHVGEGPLTQVVTWLRDRFKVETMQENQNQKDEYRALQSGLLVLSVLS